MPPLEDLKKIQSTRKMLADNVDSIMLRDLVEHTLIRFSINNGKYILGLVKNVVPTQGEKKYVISYQKQIGFDK